MGFWGNVQKKVGLGAKVPPRFRGGAGPRGRQGRVTLRPPYQSPGKGKSKGAEVPRPRSFVV